MTGRAFGKVILLGEHAVVYGHPALAAGISPGVDATLGSRAGAYAELTVRPWNVTVRSDVVPPAEQPTLDAAFAALVAELGEPARGARLEATAHLPPGGGLGSSAALGVAIARAVLPDADDARIDAAAHVFESVFHGNPSGLDAAVAARGGVLYFRRGQAPDRVAPKRPLRVCLGHCGVGASTRTMVEGVARQRERAPAATARSLEAIGELVKNARIAIEDGDVVGLGQLFDLNQILLAGLFVSTPELERLCRLARAAGALGAKLTGAGGGGAVVALVEERSADVLAAWKAEGFTGVAAEIA